MRLPHGELVGGVLLATGDRQAPQVDHRVRHLVQERGLGIGQDALHQVLLAGVLHDLADLGEVLDAELDPVLLHQVLRAVLAGLHQHRHIRRKSGYLLHLVGGFLQPATLAQRCLKRLELVGHAR